MVKNISQLHLPLGITDLRKELSGKTAIFLGQSGVGKSSLINRLSGGEFELKTKEIGRAEKELIQPRGLKFLNLTILR